MKTFVGSKPSRHIHLLIKSYLTKFLSQGTFVSTFCAISTTSRQAPLRVSPCLSVFAQLASHLTNWYAHNIQTFNIICWQKKLWTKSDNSIRHYTKTSCTSGSTQKYLSERTIFPTKLMPNTVFPYGTWSSTLLNELDRKVDTFCTFPITSDTELPRKRCYSAYCILYTKYTFPVSRYQDVFGLSSIRNISRRIKAVDDNLTTLVCRLP